MANESIVGGGKLVRLQSGASAVEGVPDARRGLVVTSASIYADGDAYKSGQYELTRRVIAGSDLWHVRRLGAIIV